MTELNRMFIAQSKTNPNAMVRRPGSLALLEFVEEKVTKEFAGLKFNYSALNEECINTLRLLRAEFIDTWNRITEIKGYGGSEASSLFHVAEDVIMFGVFLDETRDPEGRLLRKQIQRAGQIVQESIRRK